MTHPCQRAWPGDAQSMPGDAQTELVGEEFLAVHCGPLDPFKCHKGSNLECSVVGSQEQDCHSPSSSLQKELFL